MVDCNSGGKIVVRSPRMVANDCSPGKTDAQITVLSFHDARPGSDVCTLRLALERHVVGRKVPETCFTRCGTHYQNTPISDTSSIVFIAFSPSLLDVKSENRFRIHPEGSKERNGVPEFDLRTDCRLATRNSL